MVNNNKEVLLQIIAEWLEEWQVPDLVPREGYGVKPDNLKRILAIVGPRRAGKTYFMYQLVQSLIRDSGYSKKDILFIDFEDFRLSGFTSRNIEDFLAAFYQLSGRYPRFLFFDEIQNLPEWSRVLRTLNNQRRFKIIISGSNSKLLSGEISTELRGRYDNVRLLPFSFREYMRYRGISFTQATLYTAARGKVVSAFDMYIRHGGFPEIIMADNDAERRMLIQNYYRTIFYRDILERFNIKARYVLDAMMSDFLETYSSVFSITSFEKHLKNNAMPGSKRTIANYLHYLQEAFFILRSEKFSFSPRRRTMNPKKIYLIDTGFASAGRPFIENRGRVLENLVAEELFRHGIELYYFKQRSECDFIIKDELKLQSAIQVSWVITSNNRKREVAGIVEACKVFGLNSGMILTYDQEEQIQKDGIKISLLPVWKWLLTNNIAELYGA